MFLAIYANKVYADIHAVPCRASADNGVVVENSDIQCLRCCYDSRTFGDKTNT